METRYLIIAGIGSALVSVLIARFVAWSASRRDAGDRLAAGRPAPSILDSTLWPPPGGDGGGSIHARTYAVGRCSPYVSPEEYGRIAYNAYCASAGGKSLVSGDPLPAWDDLPHVIQLAWTRAASSARTAM